MKTHKELIKTVAITILVTANISFLGGVWYANKNHDHVKREVNSAVQGLKAELSSTTKQ